MKKKKNWGKILFWTVLIVVYFSISEGENIHFGSYVSGIGIGVFYGLIISWMMGFHKGENNIYKKE